MKLIKIDSFFEEKFESVYSGQYESFQTQHVKYLKFAPGRKTNFNVYLNSS